MKTIEFNYHLRLVGVPRGKYFCQYFLQNVKEVKEVGGLMISLAGNTAYFENTLEIYCSFREKDFGFQLDWFELKNLATVDTSYPRQKCQSFRLIADWRDMVVYTAPALVQLFDVNRPDFTATQLLEDLRADYSPLPDATVRLGSF